MKKLFFKSIVLLLGISLVNISCTKDENNNNVSQNVNVNSYLKNFYKTNFHLGKSVEGRLQNQSRANMKTAEAKDFVITEVFTEDDVRARGYVITSKSTNVFLYFVDVDREFYKMFTEEIATNDSKYFNNIDQINEWISSNQFDLIKLTNDYLAELTSTPNEERTFFGSNFSYLNDDSTNNIPTLFQDNYICGIRIAHHQVLNQDSAKQKFLSVTKTQDYLDYKKALNTFVYKMKGNAILFKTKEEYVEWIEVNLNQTNFSSVEDFVLLMNDMIAKNSIVENNNKTLFMFIEKLDSAHFLEVIQPSLGVLPTITTFGACADGCMDSCSSTLDNIESGYGAMHAQYPYLSSLIDAMYWISYENAIDSFNGCMSSC